MAASSGPVAQSPRAVLYNAIFACAADGAYSPAEQALIRRLGAKFGIGEEIVSQIEEVYWASRRLREQRIALLFDQRMPY